jgi:predicted nuclease of restriction endonuclease-like (RecB) superfamily
LALLPLKDPLQREFYAQMCRIEGWSVRIRRQKIERNSTKATSASPKEALARKLHAAIQRARARLGRLDVEAD